MDDRFEGEPMSITLRPGNHVLSATHHFTAGTTVSELWIIGHPNATVELASGSADPVLVVESGAPPIHLIGITLLNPVHVDGGELRASDCAWRGTGGPDVAEGGGLLVSGGVASVVGEMKAHRRRLGFFSALMTSGSFMCMQAGAF